MLDGYLPAMTQIPVASPDLLLVELKEQLSELMAERDDLKASIREIRKTLYSLQDDHDELVDRFNAMVTHTKSSQVPGPKGIKTAARLARLDEILFSRPNHTATFSEIGKLLELGSNHPNTKKNTRRQNMTHFANVLQSHPDRYIIEDGKIQNSKRVRLTPEWVRHLQIQKKKQV